MHPEFVTFHSDRPVGATTDVHPNANLNASEYAQMIDRLFRSARIFHPDSQLTLLTDEKTSLSGISHEFQRFNRSIDHSSLMLERTRLQNQYVQQSAFENPLVLLDSDIVINGKLDKIFDADFDIALTWRENKAMPINGGLVVLNNRRPMNARRFFEELLEIFERKFAAESSWFGDQLAIADWLCASPALRALGSFEHRGCKVQLLDCDTYNFSPRNRWGEVVQRNEAHKVIHFKGERKRLMEAYWRAHLQELEAKSIWSRVQGARWRSKIRSWQRQEEQTP